jgi:rubrerythrin
MTDNNHGRKVVMANYQIRGDSNNNNNNNVPEEEAAISTTSPLESYLILFINNFIEVIFSSRVINEVAYREIKHIIDTTIKGSRSGSNSAPIDMTIITNMYNILHTAISKYVTVAIENQDRVDNLVEELSKEKIKNAELKAEAIRIDNMHESRKDNNKGDSRTNNEVMLLCEVAKIEAESQVRNLLLKIQDLEQQHRIEINKLKLDIEERETFFSCHEGVRGGCDSEYVRELTSTIEDLERNLQNEKLRRQQLQSRLMAEESSHKREMEDAEKMYLELQKRAEKAELAWTKLKMEYLHHNRVV